MSFLKMVALTALAFDSRIFAAGDFSTSELASVQVKAEEMFATSQNKKSYVAQVETQLALMQNQTATVDSRITDPNKDMSVKINWLDASGITTYNPLSQCTLSGPELQSKAKVMSLGVRQQVSFSINEEKLRTSIYSKEELAAMGQLGCMKALDEFLAKTAVAKLKSFAGTNLAPLLTGSAGTGTTNVTTANYNKNLLLNLVRTGIMNKISDAFLIDGGELWTEYMNAKLDQGNAEGKGTAKRFELMDMYFDLWNFTAAGITEDTFLIARYAYAFANKIRYKRAPIEYRGKVNQTRYAIESANIPGVMYDAYYELKCLDNTTTKQSEITHTWMYEFNGDWLLNPEGAFAAGNTGILSFTKVA